jgi:micrococcal nuclease
MTIRRLACWVAVAVLLCGLAGPTGATSRRTLSAAVERVSDGDTVVAVTDDATKLRIRLLGIDAPEISHGKGPGQPFGAEAQQHLERLIGGRSVRLESFGPDAYKRVLAVIWVGNQNVNVEMVRAGLAEIYRGSRCQAYCRELAEAEGRAQRAHLGIWTQPGYESPASYRKRLRVTS